MSNKYTGVRTLNADYYRWHEIYEKCRAAFGGEDAVKAMREEALPPREGMKSGPPYEAYLQGAQWFGATARTIVALSGSVFRRDPSITVPHQSIVESWLEDVTMTGTPLKRLMEDTLQEQLLMGRRGILVDKPDNITGTVAIRPYMAAYDAESIINWVTYRIDGQEVVVLVVLREPWSQPLGEFAFKRRIQYRVLDLVSASNTLTGRAYRVRIFRNMSEAEDEEADGDAWVSQGERFPLRGGQYMDRIPFHFAGVVDVDSKPDKPPMLDLVNVNFALFRNSADYERALSYTGAPVYWGSGIEAGTDQIIGPGAFLNSSLPDARFGMLQAGNPEGLRQAMSEKKHELAVLGARMLEDEKAAAEAEGTVRLRRSGEGATLRGVAETNAACFRNAIDDMLYMMQMDEGAEVENNTDFVDASLSPEQITAYMALQQDGDIAPETLYHLLEKGEITRPGVDFKEEQAAIEAGAENTARRRQTTIAALEGQAA